jgi:hypothetical protein
LQSTNSLILSKVAIQLKESVPRHNRPIWIILGLNKFWKLTEQYSSHFTYRNFLENLKKSVCYMVPKLLSQNHLKKNIIVLRICEPIILCWITNVWVTFALYYLSTDCWIGTNISYEIPTNQVLVGQITILLAYNLTRTLSWGTRGLTQEKLAYYLSKVSPFPPDVVGKKGLIKSTPSLFEHIYQFQNIVSKHSKFSKQVFVQRSLTTLEFKWISSQITFARCLSETRTLH